MKGIHLINYSVKGIKSLDEDVSLSFYKKSFISEPTDFQNYNIKGIYGINGSGKSAIVTSVRIFKNLIVNQDYLNNPIIQSQLNALINRKLQRMEFSGEFFLNFEHRPCLFRYEISLCKEKGNRLVIDKEKLSMRIATSRNEEMRTLFKVTDGKIEYLDSTDNDFKEYLIDKTKNLLKTAALPSFILDIIAERERKEGSLLDLYDGFVLLYLFGLSFFVYMDKTDDHADYFIDDVIMELKQETDREVLNHMLKAIRDSKRLRRNEMYIGRRRVSKKNYSSYENRVSSLFGFISIFKRDLKGILIDKKDNNDVYECDLIMDYGDYKINVEFESTGIKKLIKLYEYFEEMASGNIVFIDELDSNLHDVYLCALLEYLMEYGKGQLCFTTHNIGPMDVLKKNKKSIEFLSVNHKIYSWTKNGNYSPAKLYKNGMIEGSPFNIDSMDFISVFNAEEGDD